ncbi:MAG: DUF1501 domain-containing protein [Acidimicrobiales bacterium]
MLAVGGLAALGIPELAGNAEAAPLGPDERILVTILLSGGNDGLNTLVPLEDGRYRRARGDLAVRERGAHPVGEGLYLHPNLRRLAGRYGDGEVAIVRGVGDSLDDRSHFVNLARWMAGTSAGAPWYTGWLGRYLDGLGADDLSGVSIGYSGSPLVIARRRGGSTSIPPFGGLFGMDLEQRDSFTKPVYNALLGLEPNQVRRSLGPWAADIAAATSTAIETGSRIAPMFPEDDPLDEVEDSLLRDATLAARLINLNVGARIIHIGLDGFDHHEGQRPQHDEFMASLDRAIDRIMRQVHPRFRDRVMIMTYSEFGRRVEPTGSGTDHGTAAPLFVVGSGVKGGMYGEQPSLGRLDERGDFRHTVDFRSVYATILDDWLDADPDEILGRKYDQLGFVARQGSRGPTCMGRAATIVGGANQKRIVGTNGDDVIVTRNPDGAIIDGRGGDDIICGGPGDDVIRGGAGNDRIDGRAGNDRLFGGAGRDTLRAGAGNDRLVGGKGRDRLIGRKGRNVIVGDRRQDTIRASRRDIITGLRRPR